MHTSVMVERWLNLNVKLFISNINNGRAVFNNPITTTVWHSEPSIVINNNHILTGVPPSFHFIGKNEHDIRTCFVLYEVGRIVCCRTYDTYLCLSFQFEGCYMARFKYNGITYVGHIYRNTDSLNDCKDIWNSFINGCYGSLSDVVLLCYNNRFATLAYWIFTLVGTGGPALWHRPFPDR